MTCNDEAYWLGFTAGRNDRRTAGARSPYRERHEAALGPVFSVGHRDGWNTHPNDKE